jgi:polyisoprenoid-binding protein YceI
MTTSGTWTIDPSHSSVEFSVKHMMVTTTKGRFSGVSGTVEIPESGVGAAKVDVAIDADTVDTRDEKRDEHLRSNDFFGAGDNPQITFRSTGIEPNGGGELKVLGDLTIKGVTRPVVLDTEFHGEGVNPWGMTVAGYSATTKINREDFGVTWNAALETGGVLVSNDVKINLDLELVKQG